MVKEGDILYTARGRDFIVRRVEDSLIQGIEIIEITITENAGRNTRRNIKEKEASYFKSDLGIRLFFNKEDLDLKSVGHMDCYKFNIDNINKHLKDKEAEIIKNIMEDAPRKPISIPMSKEEKRKKIQEYLDRDISLRKEMDFYRMNSDFEYFGRIDLDTDYYKEDYEDYFRKNYYERFYIGYKTDLDRGIISWREDIASIYYDSENLNFKRKESSTYDSSLMLRRSYSFDPLNYKNLYIVDGEAEKEGIKNPFLMETLKKNREKHRITDIVRTIERNQNRIIRASNYENIIVQGCAGSGKSMVLFHRLSYLKYNGFLADESKVKIITPNKLFIDQMGDLMIDLEIDEIDQMEINEYYYRLIERYIDDYSLDKRLLSEIDLNESIVVENGVNNFIDREYMNYLDQYIEKISFINGPNANNFNSDIAYLKELYAYIDRLDKIYRSEELRAKLRSLELEKSSIELRVKDKSMRLKLISNIMFNMEKGGQNHLKDDDKNMLIYSEELGDEAFNEIYQNYRTIIDLYNSIYLEYRESYLDLIEGLENEEKTLLEKEKEIEELSSHLPRREEVDRLKSIKSELIPLDRIGRRIFHHIKDVLSEKELLVSDNYLLIRTLILLYGPLITRDKFIFIDEGQDYSLDEFETIDNANGRLNLDSKNHAIMNIFGDMNQRISDRRGLRSWEDLVELLEADYYELNENYRNTIQIAQYCESELGIRSLAVGLDGEEIFKLNSSDFYLTLYAYSEDSKLDSERIALITKTADQNVKDRIYALNKNLLIIEPAEAKGLEFDTVFVDSSDMSRNEKYIAYTRSLNKLYITGFEQD